jgi:hypothetical protein
MVRVHRLAKGDKMDSFLFGVFLALPVGIVLGIIFGSFLCANRDRSEVRELQKYIQLMEGTPYDF